MLRTHPCDRRRGRLGDSISSALLFRAQGLQVGVVRSGRAALVPITIGHDYGATVEVARASPN